MKTWFMRHLQTCVGTLGRLAAQRTSTVLTMLVIGIALSLPACLEVLIVNARAASGDVNRVVNLSVYLKLGTTAAQAEQTAAALQGRKDVLEARLTKADDALKEFRDRAGFGDALDALSDNPLPHTIVIRPSPDRTERSQLEALATELRAMPNVDVVQLDSAWVDRFNAMLDVVRRGVWVVASLLGFGVLVIVGNVIRSEIQTRQAEIEVTKLVGGTDAFVRRPFLYAGLWYGVGGGLIALVVSYIVVALLSGPIHRLAGLYGSDFHLYGLEISQALAVVGASALLGWMGSLVAASRHLRDIEPR